MAMNIFLQTKLAAISVWLLAALPLLPASAAALCSPLAPCLNGGQIATDSKQPVVTQDAVDGVPTGPGFWDPMTFRLGPSAPFSHGQIVYAIGQFNPQTGNQFENFLSANGIRPGALIVLNSPGGDPDSGIQMGRAIRANSLNTYVGEAPSSASGQLLGVPQIGICASACSLAFLGGIERTVPDGSLYGVHDVSLTGASIPVDPYDSGQKEAADLESYITDMGIDPGLLTVLTQYNSNQDEILFMSAQQMAQLKVTTGFETNWQLQDVGGTVALVGSNPPSSTVPGSDDAIGITCAGGPQQANIEVAYLSEDPHSQLIGGTRELPPASFVALVDGYRLTGFKSGAAVSDQPTPVQFGGSGSYQRPEVADANHVGALVPVTPAVLGLLQNSDVLTFAFLGVLPTLGQVQFDLSSGRQEILDFIKNCR
jgi:hypothetical protein